MADKKKMSVEEILAACRGADGQGAAAAPGSASRPEEPAEPAAAAPPAEPAEPPAKPPAKRPDKPAAPPAAKPAVKPGAMSIADILAAARGEKSGEKPAAVAPAKADQGVKPDQPPAKSAPPKVVAEAKPVKAKEGAAPAGIKDTASILAAARKASKPGPMSKAEAAAKADGPPKPAGKKEVIAPPMPERPAFLRPSPAPVGDGSRRGFLASLAGVFLGSSLAVGFTTLGLTHLMWGLGLARFMFPNILTEPPTRFKVGSPDDYGPGQVETKYIAQFGVWIVRYEYESQPQIYAIQSVCTHLGCTPNWLDAEQKFKCPCHGSGFYKDGINFEGPAPRPLERFAIRLADDGQLEVDKSRKFQEELGQWKDPASFVPV